MSADTTPEEAEPDRATAAERPLSEHTCVVTGASRGIGRAVALELGRQGARVVVNYRSSETAAESVADEIESLDGSGTALPVRADVGDREAVRTMADRVHETFGPVDALVNNAGVTSDARFDDLDADDWHRVIDINLGGAFNCTKAFYDDLRAADEGRLVNVSSVVGQQGNYGQSNYAASKSALFGFTRSLALELAPHGSTANCVAPGYTRTDMIEPVREEIKDRIRGRIPLDRFAAAEEIACTVRFLLEPDASYVTGEILNVNGGMYC